MLKDYWTAEAARAELLLSCLLTLLPKPHDELLKVVQVLFPLMRFDDLKPVLMKRASLSKRELKWSLKASSR